MISQARLYDAFGEIIYAVAIADGLIQKEEVKVIEERLAQFSWGNDAKWSFNWERKKETELKDAYLKARCLYFPHHYRHCCICSMGSDCAGVWHC